MTKVKPICFGYYTEADRVGRRCVGCSELYDCNPSEPHEDAVTYEVDDAHEAWNVFTNGLTDFIKKVYVDNFQEADEAFARLKTLYLYYRKKATQYPYARKAKTETIDQDELQAKDEANTPWVNAWKNALTRR